MRSVCIAMFEVTCPTSRQSHPARCATTLAHRSHAAFRAVTAQQLEPTAFGAAQQHLSRFGAAHLLQADSSGSIEHPTMVGAIGSP